MYAPIAGCGRIVMPLPLLWPAGGTSAIGTGVTLDALNEHFAYVGQVNMPVPGSNKTLTKVHTNLGAITTDTGSATVLKCALQDVDTAAGGPYRPDGTDDQSVSLDLTAANFPSSNVYYTFTLDSSRSNVSHGDQLGVVFTLTARSAGSIVFRMVASSGAWMLGTGGAVSNLAGTWAILGFQPNVVLEFDDGTFGTLDSSLPVLTLNSVTFDSGSATDEYALQFRVPFGARLNAMWWGGRQQQLTGTHDVILYSDPAGTPSADVTITWDQHINWTSGSTLYRFHKIWFPTRPYLKANTDYAVALRPTDATSDLLLQYYSFNSTSYIPLVAMDNWKMVGRANQSGAFAATNSGLDLPLILLEFSDIAGPAQPSLNIGI